MTADSVASPEDQGATFVELFFDLVFVFAITRVTHYAAHHMDAHGLARSLIVFWMIWWGWTQFTWALNAADTTHAAVQLGTLLATGVAFFMAAALPGAFSGDAIWFAAPYVLLRVIGLALYIRVAWAADASQHAAVRTFAFMSAGGLAAVLAGAIAGGATLYWLWGLAILLDVIAAMASGESEGWNLHPEHCGERHALFVIIALGESLIVAGGGLAEIEISPNVVAVGAFAVATICALWWSYFARAKLTLDHEMGSVRGADLSKLARDAYSLLHFPMILGVIGVAVAMYIVLDGFDLGIGVLFPFTKSETERDQMMRTIAPFWDGNETWLILGGVGLFVAFLRATSMTATSLLMPLAV